jgi:hypothetical protein
VSVRRLVSASPGGLNHSERVSASAGCWGAMAASVSGRVIVIVNCVHYSVHIVARE